ncbi:MAG TPA: MerR family transcriptional regulator [Flavipsychrobacter sp.]|nr:MerR family transcriptional regulator [Flavipsychrobacter sp.]
MNRFSIKDIENLTGIKAHTIRIWEQRYGILQPKRTPTNIRYYDSDDLKLALRVALLNSYGYKISRIHQMNAEEMNSLIGKVSDKEFRLQALVNELLEATLAVNLDLFENLIDQFIKRNGIEQTVEQLIFSFLEKIGLMWLSDRIFPAQEHLISNVIYRKIAVAIEQLPSKQPQDSPTILLFLPEGEIHDLGLLYVHYLLRKQKINPIYLGPNTPLKEALFVYEMKSPEYIYLHLTSIVESFDCNKYLQKVSKLFPDCTIYVSGTMLQSKKYHQPSNIQFLFNLKEVREALLAL